MKHLYSIVFGLISTGLIACSVGTTANANESIKEKMSRLDKETKALIGAASCASSSQCKSIGFGHKPCGGFNAYRIYSNQDTKVNQLKDKISNYNALSRKQNEDNNIVSNCMMLMQPELICRNQACVIK